MRLIIINTAALALVILSVAYIMWAHSQAARHFYPGTLVVMPIVNDSSLHFYINDFWDWEHGQVELEQVSTAMVESDNHTAFANISITGWNYLDMAFISYHHGGPWRDEDSIILSEGLAWELFGNLDVISLPVRIGSRLFTISGVSTQQENFAWILRNNYKENSNILYLRNTPYNWIFARNSILDLLSNLGRRADDYTLTSINFFLRSIELRGFILVYLAVIFLLMNLVSQALVFQSISHRAVLIAMAAALFIWLTMRIDLELWIPASGDVWEGYRQLLFNRGMLAPRQYLSGNLATLYDLNIRANAAFAVGLAGLFQMLLLWRIK